ncbi:MerR family transcriptional regulator [Nocardia cyriacigeorgica]|uniref:MerR family transcriptional regulator n=2 Tax=Nocardia cyriacigeorgica TaxID=135487 RepID=A0A6P1D3C3_9NOCA|nr:MerR family transcriptional regulator [Nocardia cyriacigeorgica]NEW37621.1 MerR family transcriptional regulator [Nocardia cyriacigeorgica]NEW45066.1 MerR family transcriptional regulator [Nocardia cyriacigeorgica]NEW55092.1 MerR family transcriptional regulator [Nocardia cyriacigeorgica]
MKSSHDDDEAEFTIGDVAARFGLATHVLRHWETMGLLQPAGRVNGRRRYNRDHLVRVAMIVRGKKSGLSLEQLRDWLDAPDRTARTTVLARQHAELARRIAEAQASQRMIEHAMECEAEEFTKCPTFRHMVAELIDEPQSPPLVRPDGC